MNPFAVSNRRFQTRHGDPIVALADPQRGAYVGANGDLNAYNKRDLMQAIASLQQMVANGEVTTADTDGRSSQEVLAARKQELAEAYSDNTLQKWTAIGQVMADEIWETIRALNGELI